MPDISELQGHQQLSVADYKSWFISTAQLIMRACPDNGVAIFFQTDIKVYDTWLDKAYLIQRAAEDMGHALLWHKVVCRVPAGTTTYGRPSYHHLLCFSKGVRVPAAASTPDVLPAAGETTWTRGMGTAACTAACSFVRSHTSTNTVVDPFCGHGTVLAVANQLGLDAIGVEISMKRAKQARKLSAVGLQLFGMRGTHQQQQQQQQGAEQEEDEEDDKQQHQQPLQQHQQAFQQQGQQEQRQHGNSQQQQQHPAGGTEEYQQQGQRDEQQGCQSKQRQQQPSLQVLGADL
jgi:hypothetical protein